VQFQGMMCVKAKSLAVLALLAIGCGSSPVPQAKTPVEPQVASGSETSLAAPSGTIKRSEVRQALSAGLGMFLQRVTFDVEHPVFRDHKFVGFRITELKGSGWQGLDLKVGDVVTAVNGFAIERPEQAQQAFLSLAVASELRVDYERDNQPRSLRLGITDD
jgi:type II secretory pathway component PulC